MVTLRIVSVTLITFILTVSINHSVRNEEQRDFFLELNTTNCFHQLKIAHLGTNSISGVAAFLLRKYISFSDYHPIRSSVCSFLV